MKVLVTGATGFIGKHLVQELISNGNYCRCLVRKSSNKEKLKDFKNIEFVEGDLTEKDTLKGIGEDMEAVVHLAAMGHVSAVTEEAYKKFIKINEEGTRNLIEACLPYKNIKRFIHYSSTAAMGLIKKDIVNEKNPPDPRTPYQRSKRDSELISLSYWEEKKFPVIILRPCMVYGPGGKGEFLKICRLMKKGIFPRIGTGKKLTPMVYVKDLVDATLLALQKGIPGETYLIASQKSYELDKLRDIIIKEIGVKRPYIYIPEFLALLGAKLIEVVATIIGKQPIVTYKNIDSTITNRYFDISKAKRELGYNPKMTVDEGVRRTIIWYKNNGLI